MKNLILYLVLFGTFYTFKSALFAQNCTPDITIKEHGYYPSKLDTATENIQYSMTIQLYSKRDTTIGTINATIDSIILDRITGLPNGLTYACNPPNCRYPSLKTGCINIFGTPATGSAGNYPLVIEVTVKATAGGSFKQNFPQKVEDFDIVVQDNTVGLPAEIVQGLLSIYPNPSTHEINIVNPNFLQFDIQLVAMSGQVLINQKSSKTVNTALSTTNLPNGIYNLLIKTIDGQVYSTKIQVIH